MKRRRVKITGIGPVTPAGIGREEFWRGILEPVSRVRPYTKLALQNGPFVAAYIEKLNLVELVARSDIPKGIARHTQFAVAGALLALRDAQIGSDELEKTSVAVVAGSSLMDFEGIGRTIEGVSYKGLNGAVPRTVFTSNASVIPSTIAEILGIGARTLSIQTSCCAGIDAIGYAADLVARGEVEISISGGTEAPLFRTPLVELRAAGLTPSTTENAKAVNRPFDLWRSTGVVSEGAAMVVIEPEDSPREGYSEILGYAHVNDKRSDLCGGLADAIRQALASSRISAEQVDAINAWGPGHLSVDAAEAAALIKVFGSGLQNIPAFSIKGAIGNPLGAAPAIQVATSALGLFHATLPPTVNWRHPDPSCPLNLCGLPRNVPHKITIVNAHGLSGVNSCLVMQRC